MAATYRHLPRRLSLFQQLRQRQRRLPTIQSHFGTAAGTLGTTIAVALIEANMSGKGIQDPVSFAAGQQFAFSVLLPLAAVALLISSGGKAEG
ncbi:hypothetical protein EPO44_19700 [bacterium]|nr:MAG: hypothetical protein EPO44_19700 [bacterium]